MTGVESHGLSEITLLQHRLSSLSDRMDHKVESSTPLAINTLCQSSRPASCCSFALDHPSPLSINEFSWQHQQQQQPYSNSLKCSSASSGNQIRSTEVSFYNFGHSSPG
ncbi:unnamed protein product [Protopolystoma xenopodis]|uniref:Uncharacterized protein n=1 Tax=Protopolystoma xenopodis TaxID=117903 RepID=A0A3S5AJF0_9PLAT|nr:unnamed protein product [Protopolystoma xenopodis]